MGHEFEVRKEIELPATPEQVWDAIATGPGLDSWFMGRSEIEPREGGAARLTLGGHTDEATIVGWEPGKRYADRTATADDGSFMALEYLIEGRDQGSTVLRLVQSGMLGDNWETEFEAMKVGWDLYLGTLAAYLRHFLGHTATPVTVLRPDAGDPDQVWPAIAAALGTAHPITEGAAARIALPGGPTIDGTVDLAEPMVFLGVRTTCGLYRFVHSGRDRGNTLFLSHHVFDPGAEPLDTEQFWQQWLDQLPSS